ncbi:MAG: helix-turn-helix transcriptional regulator [Lachnospiraceae bacterium]|nr:helix-turn-helix transcriptional regulator [Lachnospiraceae bacterium]
MKCNEKGTVGESAYYFFSPSEMFREYYCHMLLCGHFYCNENYRIVREGNASPLFIYMISGELHVNYQSQHYTASDGEIILLNCNQPHAYYCNSSCEFIFFHYDGPTMVTVTNHLIAQNNAPVFRLSNHTQLSDALFSVLTTLEQGEYPSDITLSCTSYQILCQMQSFNYVTTGAPSSVSDTIAEVIEYMKKNIQEPLSLDIIAAHVNISPSYLSHQFRTQTGCSPIEYLAGLKINYAKTILRSTTRTIADIADSLGYSSSASFINAFTSRVGISPGQFRKSSIY